jgi:transposase
MAAKPYPTDLTDAEWNCIKDLIPLPKLGGRHRELDMRAVVNAIFYVVDGGITWRMLPHEYPKWPSVYWGSRSNGTINNAPLEAIVFTAL